jgi:hypothetical protein
LREEGCLAGVLGLEHLDRDRREEPQHIGGFVAIFQCVPSPRPIRLTGRYLSAECRLNRIFTIWIDNRCRGGANRLSSPSGDTAISDTTIAHGGIDVEAGSSSPFTDVRLEQAYRYWRSKAAGRVLPRRADIDPTEIPKLLPDVMLVERLIDGRYRYRLIGTENADAHGFNATGRYLDEVLPGPHYAAHVLGLYDECMRNQRALYSECLFFPPAGTSPNATPRFCSCRCRLMVTPST